MPCGEGNFLSVHQSSRGCPSFYPLQSRSHQSSAGCASLSPAVPSSGSSSTAWVERVEKQRRWASPTPLAGVRVKDIRATVFPYTNRHPGPVLLSAVTCTGLSGWDNYTLSWAFLVRIWPNTSYLKAGRFFRVCLHKIDGFIHSLTEYFCSWCYPVSQL